MKQLRDKLGDPLSDVLYQMRHDVNNQITTSVWDQVSNIKTSIFCRNEHTIKNHTRDQIRNDCY